MKKELGEVKEQPGSKQKLAPKDKKMPEVKEPKGQEKEKAESKEHEAKESKFESKLKKEKETEGHETGLNHPAAQYESYKRPRRDS